MKTPVILTFMAVALGTTAGYAATASGMFELPALASAAQTSPDASPMIAEHESWLRFASNDDDDDEDEEDDEGDCDDEDCKDGKAAAPTGPVTPPSNGLFSTGKLPVVKSN